MLTLLALDTEGAEYKMYALDQDQHHVVNHLKGEEVAGAARNILDESARIARGEIEPLTSLNVTDFDALVIPGGFGVAKNMCSFAFEGSAASVDEQVLEKVLAFNTANKPIGAICISPALVALAIGSHKAPTLTIGTDEGTAAELEKLGATHQNSATSDCVVDSANKIVTTPAYMDDSASLVEIHQGISKLVKQVIALV